MSRRSAAPRVTVACGRRSCSTRCMMDAGPTPACCSVSSGFSSRFPRKMRIWFSAGICAQLSIACFSSCTVISGRTRRCTWVCGSIPSHSSPSLPPPPPLLLLLLLLLSLLLLVLVPLLVVVVPLPPAATASCPSIRAAIPSKKKKPTTGREKNDDGLNGNNNNELTTTMAALMADWFWYDDKKWVKYDAAVSRKLEEGYWRGDAKVGTDAERFVEIVRPQTDAERVLRENFRRLPPRATGLVGMQRRYDDESRRRIVQRKSRRALNGLQVCLLPPDGPTDMLGVRLCDYRAMLVGLPPVGTIPLHGVVAVATRPDDSDIVRARTMCDAVVTPDWLTKVFEDGRDVPTAPYLLKQAPKPAPVPAPAPAVAVAVEGEPAKKRPREDEGEGEKKPEEERFETTRPLLYTGTVLSGTVTYTDGQRVAVVVRVATVAHRGALCDAYEGEMTWVDLHDACTRVRGTLRTAPGAGSDAAWETVLRLEEYAVVRGADEVDVPAHYELRLADDGRTLTGRTCSSDNSAATTEDSADIALTADRPLLPAWAVAADDSDAGRATCTRFAVAPGQTGLVVPAHAQLPSTVAAGAAVACAWPFTVVRACQTGSRTQTFVARVPGGGAAGKEPRTVAGTLAGTHLRLALDGADLVFDGEWRADARAYEGVLRRAAGAEEACTVRLWHRLPAVFAVAHTPDPLAPCRGRTLHGRVLLPANNPTAPHNIAQRRPKHIVVRNAFAEPPAAAPLAGSISTVDVFSAKELNVCYAEFHFVEDKKR